MLMAVSMQVLLCDLTKSFREASTQQQLVAKSLFEAEIIGVSENLSNVIWARNFLISQALEIRPAKVFQE